MVPFVATQTFCSSQEAPKQEIDDSSAVDSKLILLGKRNTKSPAMNMYSETRMRRLRTGSMMLLQNGAWTIAWVV